MISSKPLAHAWRSAVIITAVFGVVACSSMDSMDKGSSSASANQQAVTLTGANEVPPVNSSGSGTGTVTITPSRAVSGSITVTGITPTAAHIHEAAAGANGPVIVPMTKSGDNTFVFGPNASLTEAQYASYKAGKLYVNVHTAANPGGELRAQLKGS